MNDSQRNKLELMVRLRRPRLMPCNCNRKACTEKHHYDGTPEQYAEFLEKLAQAKAMEARNLFQRAKEIKNIMNPNSESWI